MRQRQLQRAGARSERGSATVEFGLVVPLFLAMVMGLVTTAFVFFTQHQLSTAAQEGARVMYLGGNSAAATNATSVAAGSPTPTISVSHSACSNGTTVTVTASRPASIQLIFFPAIDLTVVGKGVVRCQ